ncbi:hypothetical protein PBAC_27800 [Pedobacter glucosidilyticus]|nr:hypothetical protein PBAC_27800 [Pedobacter glucosidilyticus]
MVTGKKQKITINNLIDKCLKDSVYSCAEDVVVSVEIKREES